MGKVARIGNAAAAAALAAADGGGGGVTGNTDGQDLQNLPLIADILGVALAPIVLFNLTFRRVA